jgi:hypothetical protein
MQTQDDMAAARVFSTSYFHPGRGHLAHYESYLMRAVDHKGFLDVQEEEGGGEEGEDGEWRTRYCVLKDGLLSIYKVGLEGRGWLTGCLAA